MDNKGKYFEEVVGLIERSINKDAHVEVDKMLPVINSKIGRERQCDVVLRQGLKHRETLTIIEVQNRSRQTTINDFNGWIGKMKEVGAQHLYCVSKQKFPRSIIEKAEEFKGSVILINLNEEIPDKMPIMLLHEEDSIRFFDIPNGEIKLKGSRAPKEIVASLKNNNELAEIIIKAIQESQPKFSFDGKTLHQFNNVVSHFTNHDNTKKGKQILEIDFESKNKVFFHFNNLFLPIAFYFNYEWALRFEKPQSTVHMKYVQNDFGELAWLIESKISSGSKENLFRALYTLNKDKTWKINILNIPNAMNVELNVIMN